MRKKFALLSVIAMHGVLFIYACQPVTNAVVPTQTSRPTFTPTLSLTPTPTFTLTPSPTSTPTITPTIIGGSESKIAFIARDPQGVLNLYTDGFFTGQPKVITKILIPEKELFIELKWSPDGMKLAFTNDDENKERWVFVYDVVENSFQKIYKVPSGRGVGDYKWSPDHSTIKFSTWNSTCCNPGLAYFQVNLTVGTIERIQGDGFWINSVSHFNSQTVCGDYKNPVIRRLRSVGYDWRICYFPEMGLYGGMKYQADYVDYDLLTEDGQVQKTLYRFPPETYTNGYIDLLLSPDRSRVLMVGEPGRPVKDYMEPGIPFAIPVSMTDTSVETVSSETLFYSGNVYAMTPPPHELFSRSVYGWSPDSKSYLEARFYYDGYNSVDWIGKGEFVVINADTGDVIYVYSFQNDLQPITLVHGEGFDIVWPVQP